MNRNTSQQGLWFRIGRIIRLAEQVLSDLAGEPPSQEMFARYRAFRWESRRGRGRVLAIEEPIEFDLDDLIGVDRSVTLLVENIEQFVAGFPSNHVLLYGERGTGKSSAVKGLLPRFASRGMRMIEVQKSDLMDLPSVLAALRGVPYRFLLFCDDLSFDAGESDYRALKAALEGSLVSPADNVRIIATSNRRHLLPETDVQNQSVRLDNQGELQLGEAIDEKLALSDRFGLALGFYAFTQDTYLAIVSHYAAKLGIRAPASELREEALRWALRRSSRSGRTARQFIDDFAGRESICRD